MTFNFMCPCHVASCLNNFPLPRIYSQMNRLEEFLVETYPDAQFCNMPLFKIMYLYDPDYRH